MRTLGLLARLGFSLTTGVAAALAALPATAAAAAVPGSTSSSDVVLSQRCQQHEIDYTVPAAEGAPFWRLEVQVFDPDGFTSQGNVFTSATSATTGSFTVQFCGSETPGTYTVHATGFTQFVPAVEIPFALPDSRFRVRRAATRTTMASRPLDERHFRLAVSVADERPAGFRPTDSADVRLQRLVDGTWRVVRGSRVMTDHGRARIRLTAQPGTTLRAVTTGSGYYAGSTSAPVTIQR